MFHDHGHLSAAFCGEVPTIMTAGRFIEPGGLWHARRGSQAAASGVWPDDLAGPPQVNGRDYSVPSVPTFPRAQPAIVGERLTAGACRLRFGYVPDEERR